MELSSSEFDLIEKIQSMPTTESISFIKVNDLVQASSEGRVNVRLNESNDLYSFKMSHIRVQANGDYTWYGELDEIEVNGEPEIPECVDGTLLVIKTGETINGNVNVGEEFYNIRPIGTSNSVLIRLNEEEIGQGGCFSGSTSESKLKETMKSQVVGFERNTSSNCPVRILTLYMEELLDDDPTLISSIEVGIEETKVALIRSKVYEQDLKLINEGTYKIPTGELVLTEDIFEDREGLSSNDYIISMREQYHADIVFIVTPDVYPGISGAVLGPNESAFAGVDSAFAIIAYNYLSAPSYTFAHEFGHFFGCHHEGTDICAGSGDDSGVPFAHGYHFSKGILCWKNDYRTIVTTCPYNSITRLLNYSNPDVEFKGKNTGRSGRNDNARKLRRAACRVANYVDDSALPYIYLNGPEENCPSEWVSVKAFTENVPNPRTFTWAASYDGINFFGHSSGSNPNYSVFMPPNHGDRVYIRCIAGNVNGPFTTIWHDVRANENDFSCKRENENSEVLFQSLTVYPNPSSGLFFTSFNDYDDKILELQVMDQAGKVVNRQVFSKQNAPLSRYKIDISNLPKGHYLLRVVTDEKVVTKKMQLIK